MSINYLCKNRHFQSETVNFVSMKKNKCLFVRRAVLLCLWVGVLVFRFVPSAGEWYARCVYPPVSFVLSWLASWVPCSLDEWVVVLGVGWLLAYPVRARRRGRAWRMVWIQEGELLLWIYVWFYWGWGLNYFRADFFRRAEVSPRVYDEAEFKEFLTDYTQRLNTSFTKEEGSSEVIRQELRQVYREVPARFGLCIPRDFQQPKYTCFNTLYSKVGVLGYMGPFFAESHVNRELLPIQYPFTYAHELSHLLGISSEAEANYWAYQVCTCSASPFVRYSGYFGILPYVAFNARMLLSESDYRGWFATIRPEVIAQFAAKQRYWDARYSHRLGQMQSALYEFYLKGNRIPSGQKNYAEVVGMLLALPEMK